MEGKGSLVLAVVAGFGPLFCAESFDFDVVFTCDGCEDVGDLIPDNVRGVLRGDSVVDRCRDGLRERVHFVTAVDDVHGLRCLT